MLKRFFVLVVPLLISAVVFSGCAGSGGRLFNLPMGPYAGPDFSGGWSGEIALEGQQNSPFFLSVLQTGGNYRGDIQVEGPAGFLAGQIVGTIDDNGAFAFNVLEGGEVVASFAGSISGTELSGNWTGGQSAGTFSGRHI